MKEVNVTKNILSVVATTDNLKKPKKTKIEDCLKFFTVREMIFKFLTCDRVAMVPIKIPKFSELELANKLNISLIQLRKIQVSQTYYKQTIGQINSSLIELYCNTKWLKINDDN